MANNKMLIDAGHPEETRVVMVRGNRVDEFDFESEHKTQLRGNIYLAKVTRVEPSLQAAFVDYGGNRHGFLAFSEIHPDYYQIPMADRQALLEAEAEEARAAAEQEDDSDDTSETSQDDPDAAAPKAEAKSDDAEEEDASQEPKPARKKRTRRRTKRKAASDDGDETASDTENAKSDDDPDAPEESDNDDDTIAADNDGDDVVSEPAQEPEKPKRRTTRRKAPVTRTDEKKAEASEDKAEEPAPKPKRKRRTKAQIEADKAAEEAAKAEKAAAAEKVVSPAEETPEEKPKPKRRRTSRKKKEAEPENNEEAVDAKADTQPAAEPEATEDEKPSEEAAASDDGSDEEEPKKTKSSRSRGTRTRRSRRGSKASDSETPNDDEAQEEASEDDTPVEEVGTDDAMEEVPARRAPRRHYKIQEVIKRRQILLVQVVKEERGNKGAALTTYLSLAGRYSVLMPNTARGGGISRKITNSSDRKRLKSIASNLEVPQGMGVILRTAGASRAPEEIQRDFEYLMRLWENVRTLTLESTAPCLVYEEGSLIKRSIRDLYDKDTGEILVAGEAGYREAKDFMTMLMPEHAKNVKEYKDRVPLFARMGVETQLDAMLQPQVTLKSGGYIIIDQTEALVAIDVNSGRSTRQHSIEDTAYQTNLEAAEEVARQLRLRDLAGLIVIDFIDMEDRRHIRSVEKRLKDALKNDRARIQVGRISHFGLMEMSRQRIRASVLESTTQVCPLCNGLGYIRSASSTVLAVLRAIEEHLHRNSRNNITVKVTTETALYLLNNKKESLSDFEERFGVSISIATDDSLGTTPCTIEKGDPSNRRPAPSTAIAPDSLGDDMPEEEKPAPVEETAQASDGENESETPDEGEPRKRRRRRRRKKTSAQSEEAPQAESAESEEPAAEAESAEENPEQADDESAEEPPRKTRRRSTRRKAKEKEPSGEEATAPATESEAPPPQEDAEPEEKPKRRATRRKPAPIAKAADTPDPSKDEAADKTPEPPRRPRRKTSRKALETDVVESSEETVEEDMTDLPTTPEVSPEETPAQAVDEKTAEPDEKPKKGWWSRKFF
ncbi:MAG: Rne/Rng family ribonuclease [Pseudomonadota bacterium]